MNEQTLKMIEGLAQKLGTTSEYLWAILIKQAPIDSCIGIGYIILAIGIGLVLWKIHKELLKQPPKEKEDYRHLDSYYEKYNNVPLVLILIVAGGWLIGCIVILCCVGSVFTGFYNPEYWALDKILNSIKPSK